MSDSRIPPTAPAWENYVVVQTVQALVGAVTTQMLSVSVEVTDRRVVLHFAMTECSETEREGINDICDELAIGLGDRIRVDAAIHIGDDYETWPGWPHRWVYRVKR